MTSEPRAIAWRNQRHITREFAAILESLRFDGDGARFNSFDDKTWARVLALCNREHLTFHLYRLHGNVLAEPIARQIESSLAENEERVRRVRAVFTEIDAEFSTAGVEFALLKGFTQYPDFVADLRYRVQYDLDFFCPADSLYRARDALRKLGYEPLQEMEAFPTDHLPLMIRKTGWQWRGDFFDPDIPVSVDLHFRFWDAETEGFDAPGVDQFWPRVCSRRISEMEFTALQPADALGYNCLHILRHLLRSSLRLSHVYELAWFLDEHAGDDAFWSEWQLSHADGLRSLQAIAFCLARSWFGCRLSPHAREEIARLPDEVDRWFTYYAAAPVERLFRPNKHELWLHLALLDSVSAARRVLRRRLFPGRMPGPVDAVYVPESQLNLRLRLRRKVRYAAHLAERAAYHTRVLPEVAWHGALWRSRNAGLTGGFWAFIVTASLFNFGLFVFVLIYNLYLLDRGYREDFLGMMNGAFTAGAVAGALPAGSILQRLGIGPAFRLCIAGTALVSVLRALIPDATPLVALAFIGGSAFSLWAVTIPPAIAQLTTERSRPRAFSLFFGISIAVGVLGGLLGGRLPLWLASALPVVNAWSAKQAALFAGCGLTLFALWPATHLRFPDAHRGTRPKYPFGPFIRRFLLALAGWNFAVGAFNPFFNTFFARHLSARADQIGIVFSAGQLAQVAAMLMAPLVLKKLGLVNGVMATQIAASLALAALAPSQTLSIAATAYACYAAFQYMSEPGVYSLLMRRVRPEEQSGASSLNFLAAFSAQAISAIMAGAAFSRFGYTEVIVMIAVVMALSAFVFRMLLRRFEAASGTLE